MYRKKWFRRGLVVLLVLFVVMNGIVYSHAWRFTHFSSELKTKVKFENLSAWDKVKYGILGVGNPRPVTKQKPQVPYKTIAVNSNVPLECWLIEVDNAKGTVLMFHGYTSDKSNLLHRAALIREMGYNTMLVDMMGAGGSVGNDVTIGYLEAQNVYDCYNYLKANGHEHITIYGVSMGAAAAMKAIKDKGITPDRLILEAPFGSMLQAVKNRFDMVGAPYFPLAHLLVFWGGAQHGFWALGHNPTAYAKDISCPTLIMYGQNDDRVKLEEVEAIASNIKGEKLLAVYPNSGHVNFLEKDKALWIRVVAKFLP